MINNPSRIFSRYRIIGNYCSDKGFCLENYANSNYVTTSTGNAFHTYNLNLVTVSDPVPENINILVSTSKGEILCAYGKYWSIWKRGKMVGEPFVHNSTISMILSIGDIVASYDEAGDFIVRDINSRNKIAEYEFYGTSTISAWCHPPTYLNKIVIGFHSGDLQLWNLLTCQLVKSLKKYDGKITCISESPALHVIAVAVKSELFLVNIENSTDLFSFKSEINEITSISFRTTTDDIYHVAFCGTNSDIVIVDLDAQELVFSIPASTNKISGIGYLPRQPILVTAGGDNAIKMWIFDNADDSCRILKYRSGISDNVTKLRFINDSTGLNLISAASNILRYTNCNRDEQSVDFSYGKLKKDWKNNGHIFPSSGLPPITDFDIDLSKEYFLDNIVTCHKNTNWVQTWRFDRKKISKTKLKYSALENQIPTCVKITACGNNCLVGYDHGSLELFNIESGHRRGSFIDTNQKSKSIVGVAVDGRNIMCASIDEQYLRLWFHYKRSLKSRLKLSFSPRRIEINRQNYLLVVTGDTLIVIVDTNTHQIIRHFSMDDVINDVCISFDGRWLIAASENSFINIWDLPSSRLIDAYKADGPVKTVTLSQEKTVLAYVQKSNNSICLLINMTLYNPTILLPVQTPKIQDEDLQTEMNNLNQELVTLSLLPDSRWRYLDKIDLIKERSKPKEIVEKTKEAPFFLPTTNELNPVFEIDQSDTKTRRKIKKIIAPVTLSKRMENYSSDKKDEFLKELLKLSPTEIDVQLEYLGDSDDSLIRFLDILIELMSTYECFEFLQGLLTLFLKVHINKLIDHKYRDRLDRIKELTETKCDKLEDFAGQALSVVGFLRSSSTYL